MKSGDILLKIDKEIIDACEPHHSDVLATMIRQCKIDSEVVFDAIRDGKPVKLTVKLEESQKSKEELQSYKDDKFEVTFRELSFDDKVSRELDENFQGVLMDRIEYGSWVMLAHACLGDLLISIDGKPTPDIESARKILVEAAAVKARTIVLFVKRGIHSLYLEVEPGWEK
jgi:membrane-associated protease RseP (regulator of RpoE activity)